MPDNWQIIETNRGRVAYGKNQQHRQNHHLCLYLKPLFNLSSNVCVKYAFVWRMLLASSPTGTFLMNTSNANPADSKGKGSDPIVNASTRECLERVANTDSSNGLIGRRAFAVAPDTSIVTAAASMKRSSEGQDEADTDRKKSREDQFELAESHGGNLLGRSYGSNIMSGEHSGGQNFINFVGSLLPTQSPNNGPPANLYTVPHYFSTNNSPFHQTDLQSHLVLGDIARNQAAAARAILLAQFNGNQSQFVASNNPLTNGKSTHFPGNSVQFNGNHSDVAGASLPRQQPLASWTAQIQGQRQNDASLQQSQQFSTFQPLDQLNRLRQINAGVAHMNANASLRNSSFASVQRPQEMDVQGRSQDLSVLLRHIMANNGIQSSIGGPEHGVSSAMGVPPYGSGSRDQEFFRSSSHCQGTPTQLQSASSQLQPATSQLLSRRNLDQPLCEEGRIESHSVRGFICLGIEEDPNWLSEFHCFVRSDLIEVFRANQDDVRARNNSISYQQVGLRCRFCAHITPSARAGRSSAFPSSLRQIYQSFTMMLRDHFSNCEAMPSATLAKFIQLKDKPAQGATDSKRYWVYSASKIGMTDSSKGLAITEQSCSEGINLPPFATVANQWWEDEEFKSVSLVTPNDRDLVGDFLYVLLAQVQPIRLTEAECIGNRRSLRVGLPGFGCRYCSETRRLGLCRMFPARRRTLPGKMNDLFDHLRRCTLCPQNVKDGLETTKNLTFQSDLGAHKEFFDRVWTRLGHKS